MSENDFWGQPYLAMGLPGEKQMNCNVARVSSLDSAKVRVTVQTSAVIPGI